MKRELKCLFWRSSERVCLPCLVSKHVTTYNKVFSVAVGTAASRNIIDAERVLCPNVFTTNCVAANKLRMNRLTPRDRHCDKNTLAPHDPRDNGGLVAVAQPVGRKKANLSVLANLRNLPI